MQYDEHFKVSARKQFQEDLRRDNESRQIYEKFLEREWVNVRSGNAIEDTRVLNAQTEMDEEKNKLVESIIDSISGN